MRCLIIIICDILLLIMTIIHLNIETTNMPSRGILKSGFILHVFYISHIFDFILRIPVLRNISLNSDFILSMPVSRNVSLHSGLF